MLNVGHLQRNEDYRPELLKASLWIQVQPSRSGLVIGCVIGAQRLLKIVPKFRDLFFRFRLQKWLSFRTSVCPSTPDGNKVLGSSVTRELVTLLGRFPSFRAPSKYFPRSNFFASTRHQKPEATHNPVSSFIFQNMRQFPLRLVWLIKIIITRSWLKIDGKCE